MCCPVTSRRCIVLEEGLRELLEYHHYQVRIVPVGDKRHFPPVHLVATRGPDETRYIRIRKISSKSRAIRDIEIRCKGEIALYRRVLSGSPKAIALHCEIWIYSLYGGYRCFEVLPGSIREISLLAPDTGTPFPDRGVTR